MTKTKDEAAANDPKQLTVRQLIALLRQFDPSDRVRAALIHIGDGKVVSLGNGST